MKKDIAVIILSCVFILLSIHFIEPLAEKERDQENSLSLIKSIEHKENRDRIIYRDSRGNITFASDLGFAIKEVTLTKTGYIEEFFDEKGIPITRELGYHAILQELCDNGKKRRTTYLGYDSQPININQGYAIIEYTYDKSGDSAIEIYLDKNGLPICSKDYGYSKRSEYEYGKAIRITFLDREKNPMKTGLGCAMMTRSYYSSGGAGDGEIKEEFYFDETGNPIAIDLGQYGVRFEYNEIGQQVALTYLDTEGKPLMNKKGYSKVSRTFNDDNSIATELYYDTKGLPVSRSEGQYGKRMDGGQESYLNADGSEQFNIKRLLYNHSYLAVVFSLLLVIASSFIERKYNLFLLIMYLGTIIYITLLFREDKTLNIYIKPFQSYKQLLTDSQSRSGILRNIWLFIPLGALLCRLFPSKRVLFFPVFFSICIELIQYFTKLGYCELDDVISNGFGGIIGYEFMRTMIRIKYSRET